MRGKRNRFVRGSLPVYGAVCECSGAGLCSGAFGASAGVGWSVGFAASAGLPCFSPGPRSIGKPTALPHSVHEPS